MNTVLRSVLTPAMASLAVSAWAFPIVYTLTANASGQMDGIAYTNALITLTATGDTVNVVDQTSDICTVPVTATVAVTCLGTDAIVDSLRMFNNRSVSALGLTDLTVQTGVLNEFAPSFSTYHLTDKLGPVTGSSSFSPAYFFATSRGSFDIDYVQDSTFTAQPVPEPSILAVLSLGMATALRRRKNA